ncbi:MULTISPECIES: hypothetical protein [unclassified Bradyrhizobium]|uniref:hypothetical protein n=1 Tax=unclassified Bradyrhizobium TaxID=2631580 RepID=UPI001FFBCFF8|nr:MULTISPECIES: hypothetical protein [unclassified Bradyrhizobium]MCK1715180.1 hypothetical protein [Bradyrhizobium sp. 143]MCK1726507.1 hypothetical protein [Bradyrhizobium sp. 142]
MIKPIFVGIRKLLNNDIIGVVLREREGLAHEQAEDNTPKNGARPNLYGISSYCKLSERLDTRLASAELRLTSDR